MDAGTSFHVAELLGQVHALAYERDALKHDGRLKHARRIARLLSEIGHVCLKLLEPTARLVHEYEDTRQLAWPAEAARPHGTGSSGIDEDSTYVHGDVLPPGVLSDVLAAEEGSTPSGSRSQQKHDVDGSTEQASLRACGDAEEVGSSGAAWRRRVAEGHKGATAARASLLPVAEEQQAPQHQQQHPTSEEEEGSTAAGACSWGQQQGAHEEASFLTQALASTSTAPLDGTPCSSLSAKQQQQQQQAHSAAGLPSPEQLAELRAENAALLQVLIDLVATTDAMMSLDASAPRSGSLMDSRTQLRSVVQQSLSMHLSHLRSTCAPAGDVQPSPLSPLSVPLPPMPPPQPHPQPQPARHPPRQQLLATYEEKWQQKQNQKQKKPKGASPQATAHPTPTRHRLSLGAGERPRPRKPDSSSPPARKVRKTMGSPTSPFSLAASSLSDASSTCSSFEPSWLPRPGRLAEAKDLQLHNSQLREECRLVQLELGKVVRRTSLQTDLPFRSVVAVRDLLDSLLGSLSEPWHHASSRTEPPGMAHLAACPTAGEDLNRHRAPQQLPPPSSRLLAASMQLLLQQEQQQQQQQQPQRQQQQQLLTPHGSMLEPGMESASFLLPRMSGFGSPEAMAPPVSWLMGQLLTLMDDGEQSTDGTRDSQALTLAAGLQAMGQLSTASPLVTPAAVGYGGMGSGGGMAHHVRGQPSHVAALQPVVLPPKLPPHAAAAPASSPAAVHAATQHTHVPAAPSMRKSRHSVPLAAAAPPGAHAARAIGLALLPAIPESSAPECSPHNHGNQAQGSGQHQGWESAMRDLSIGVLDLPAIPEVGPVAVQQQAANAVAAASPASSMPAAPAVSASGQQVGGRAPPSAVQQQQQQQQQEQLMPKLPRKKMRSPASSAPPAGRQKAGSGQRAVRELGESSRVVVSGHIQLAPSRRYNKAPLASRLKDGLRKGLAGLTTD